VERGKVSGKSVSAKFWLRGARITGELDIC